MNDQLFIGRKDELAFLEKAYASQDFEFCVVYGRRRIGKTSLVVRFCEEKRAVYHMAQRGSEAVGLEKLSEAISDSLLQKAQMQFANFEKALGYLAEVAEHERLVFVIDEFPYFCSSIPNSMSVLQYAIDHTLKKTKLMIILTGSSVSFMEQEVMGSRSPLYGRRTRTLKLNPFSLAETALLCARSPIESVLVQAMSGGVPLYVQYFASEDPLWEAIREIWFLKTGLLYYEPQFLLSMETRNPEQYAQVLALLAAGTTKPSQMADKLGVSSPHLAALLTTLQALGLVARELPFGEKQAKKGVYQISDSLFAFYLRFVYPYLSLLEQGKPEGPIRILEQYMDQFVGKQFEKMCHTYFLQHTDRPIIAISHWWGFDMQNHQNEELDLVAEDADGVMIFAECKWRSTKVGLSDYARLVQRSTIVKKGEQAEYWLFSKSGFTDELREAKLATLVSVDQMVSVT